MGKVSSELRIRHSGTYFRAISFCLRQSADRAVTVTLVMAECFQYGRQNMVTKQVNAKTNVGAKQDVLKRAEFLAFMWNYVNKNYTVKNAATNSV